MSFLLRRKLGLGVVLLVAGTLRWTTLVVPHFDSDEPAFEGVAQSLLMRNGYTARRVGIAVVDSDPPLFLVRLARDAREHGALLDVYSAAHQDVVDDHALSVRPPLFPVVLAASTALLGSDVQAVALGRSPRAPISNAEGYRRAAERPRASWARAQLAVTLPPLLASLVVCGLAFFGHRGSVLAATIAGLAVATAPLEVWSAHRVTADTLTAALVGGATLLLARSEGSLPKLALAGVLGGLSVLAKPSGVLLAPAYAAAEVVLVWRGEPWRKAARRVLVFSAVLAAVGLWWAALQLLLPGGSVVAALGYGGVGYTPEAAQADWPVFVRSRPFWIVPASTVALSPLLGAGALAVLVRAQREKESAAVASVAALFLAMTVLWPARENRYLLPAYVAFASGLGWAVERAIEGARGRATKAVLVGILLLVLAPSVYFARVWAASGAWELTPIGPAAPG